MIETGPGFFVDFTAVTLGAFTLAMVLEMLWPARKNVLSISRWLSNGGLGIITYVSGHLAATFLATLFVFYSRSGFASPLANLPLWLNVAIVYLTLEFARYWIHVAMHKVPVLWRFHAVHHADHEVDLSTAFRNHPIEAVLSAIPITAVVWILSSMPEALIIYRAWDLIMTVLTHTNTRIPLPLERLLRYIVVTPAFHRTHHLAEKRFTDSNYSASLPWFDYLFSTYQPTTEQQQESAKIGLDTHTAHEERLDGMLYAPFVQRTQESASPCQDS